MPKVSIKRLVDKLEELPDEITLYLNRKTGETFGTLKDWDPGEKDGEHEKEDGEHELDCEKEQRAKRREIANSNDWLALPAIFDFHERSIMEQFCKSVKNPAISEPLMRAIHTGATQWFRFHFRDEIRRHRIEKDWRAFQIAAIGRTVIVLL